MLEKQIVKELEEEKGTLLKKYLANVTDISVIENDMAATLKGIVTLRILGAAKDYNIDFEDIKQPVMSEFSEVVSRKVHSAVEEAVKAAMKKDFRAY